MFYFLFAGGTFAKSIEKVEKMQNYLNEVKKSKHTGLKKNFNSLHRRSKTLKRKKNHKEHNKPDVHTVGKLETTKSNVQMCKENLVRNMKQTRSCKRYGPWEAIDQI